MIQTEKVIGRKRNRPLKNYAGIRFGRLQAVSLHARDSTKENNHSWFFACDCGGSAVLKIKNVRSGKTSSCGCLARDRLSERNTTHGMTQTRPKEYRSWKDMRSRCLNPNDTDFPGYGGRGISVCDRWGDFAEFYADMGPRPDGMTLDRIDVDGNYEPVNCRWADATQQANNKRNNVALQMDGRSQTLQQWCRELGADRTKVRYRLNKGMSLREALQPGDLRRRDRT